MKKKKITLVILAAILLLTACGTSESDSSLNQSELPLAQDLQDTPDTEPEQYSGSWYSRETWPHDGHPYESPNFIVYSDAASQSAREALANVAEDLLAELIVEFGIVPESMFRFPPNQKKIHIYAYKSYYPQQWGMRAYYAGIIAWSLDHEKRNTNLESYKPVLKHELVHVVESLLKGRDVARMPVDVRVHAWFSEGLAEAMTGGTSGGAIRGKDQLTALTARYGQRNPIAYTTDGVINTALVDHLMIGFDYYYPMSQLAVEYLLDDHGLGRSPQDVRDIFLDMAEGKDFSTAFEDHMGISIQEYEGEFFDLMDDYLDEGASVPYVRLLIAWAILSAVSLILVTLSLARNANNVLGIRWAWILITALFGPLGLLCYLISYRRKKSGDSIWWHALVSSLHIVTGKGLGLFVVVAYYRFIAPNADAGPQIVVAPFLVDWLIFQAPVVSARFGISYWVALHRTILGEFLSTILVLGGMLPVLIFLPEQVWFLVVDPISPLFWGLFSLSALAGTFIVYPFSIWMAHRESAQQTIEVERILHVQK